ncbi:MAG TPA: hypothetical protein PKJ19_03235 [Flavobacteriales bacterium]|nr:hypothetical protein [Flavobacteriales bacterium]HNU56678.1 hypothetical protein [Flavobacteriales bacterium]
MRVDIFIRTYHKDLEWLSYALKSIHRYVTGYRHIIVAIPTAQVELLRHLTAEKVIGISDLQDGYLGQQLTKMRAWAMTDADAVIFWDSDVVATEPIDVRKEYFQDGKIIVWKTRYSSMTGNPWQPITTKAVGFTPEWEYMRRMPIVHWTSTLESCDRFMAELHGKALAKYIEEQPHRSFSEFNVLGAYAEKHAPDGYAFIDTESVDLPKCKADQGWSWGGLTPEVMEKLRSYGLA